MVCTRTEARVATSFFSGSVLTQTSNIVLFLVCLQIHACVISTFTANYPPGDSVLSQFVSIDYLASQLM